MLSNLLSNVIRPQGGNAAEAGLHVQFDGAGDEIRTRDTLQRRSHLICGLCPSITDTTFALQFPHMLVIHAVLDHDVSLEDVVRSRRVIAPSGSVCWRLPNGRELAVL